MGVAHKSLFHSRLTISRVTVSTTLKTPNSLTFCQLRSTTNVAASRLTVTGSGFLRYMIGIHPTILPLAAGTTRKM